MIMIVTVSDANPPWSWGSIVMAFAIYPPIGLFRLPLMCGSALFMLKTCNTKPKFANVAIMTLSPGYIFAVYTMPIVFGVRFSKLKYNLGIGTDITDAFINRSCFLLVCDLNRTPNCYGKTWRLLCPFFRNLHLWENLARDCFTFTASTVSNSAQNSFTRLRYCDK